jgi:hypothetical protein
MSLQYKPTKTERKKYIFKEKRDFEILKKIKILEKRKNLTKKEKTIIKFMRTQLEDDWRQPLLKLLDK